MNKLLKEIRYQLRGTAIQRILSSYVYKEVNTKIATSSKIAAVQVAVIGILLLTCFMTKSHAAFYITTFSLYMIWAYNVTLFIFKTIPFYYKLLKLLRGTTGTILKYFLDFTLTKLILRPDTLMLILTLILILILRSYLIADFIAKN